jgi:Zn-dependent protease with chaperone function
MDWIAAALLVLGVLLAEPVSRALATAAWPARDPVGGLLVWQAIGFGGGIALLGSGVVFGLGPLDLPLWQAVPVAVGALLDGRLTVMLGLPRVLALIAAVLLAVRLVGVLLLVTVRTLRMRRRHRDLLDLLGTPWPAVPGARVLDHPVPVAYCLPGLRSRLVLSAGVLDALEPQAVRAVLAHERAHLRERHDLVVLPFVAWGATAPFVRGMVCAQVAVARLIEMRADDVAACSSTRHQLTGALRVMGDAAPAAALSSFTAALDHRLDRILAPPPPLSFAVRVLVRLVAVVLVACPVSAILWL